MRGTVSQAENDYAALQREEDSLNIQWNNAQGREYELTVAQERAEQEMNIYQQQLSEAELELQRLIGQQEDKSAAKEQEALNQRNKMLEEMARQELEEDRRKAQQRPVIARDESSEEPGNNRLSMLARLAQMELEAEKAAANAGQQLREARDEVKQFVGDIKTTAGDVWPNAGILAVKGMFNRVQQEFELGKPPEHDGNLFIDYANRNRPPAGRGGN